VDISSISQIEEG